MTFTRFEGESPTNTPVGTPIKLIPAGKKGVQHSPILKPCEQQDEPTTSTRAIRQWVSMPEYNRTLDMMGHPLNIATVTRLINQMTIALGTLHSHQLAHMDVKPSNIFVTPEGNFLLGDFGSATTFNEKTSASTRAFLPIYRKHTIPKTFMFTANAVHDWMMLAVTVWDVRVPQKGVDQEGQFHEGKQIGQGASDVRWDYMIAALADIESTDSIKLINVLTANKATIKLWPKKH